MEAQHQEFHQSANEDRFKGILERFFLRDEGHHPLGETAMAFVAAEMNLEAARVLGDPIEGFALKIEGFELLLEGGEGDFVVGVAEDDVLDLVVDDPTAVARECGFEVWVLLHRPETKCSETEKPLLWMDYCSSNHSGHAGAEWFQMMKNIKSNAILKTLTNIGFFFF